MGSYEKPNIIVFFSDQQRWDTCGCYGQKLPITPNLDRLASEGVKFNLAFSNQPVCGPARAMLQTGKYPTEINCPTNHCLLPLDQKTVANWISEAGYEVGYIGKWHLASFGPRDGEDDYRVRPVPLEHRGGYKDYWLASDTLEFTSHSYDGHMFDQAGNRREFPAGRYRVDAQTDWALEYLDNRKTPDKPFFLFLSYIEPHHQNDHGCYEGPIGAKEKWQHYEVPGDLVNTQGDWRENYPDYLGCCNALDGALGRLLAKLEQQGIKDNTLVIFTSDHGSHFRTRNGEYKRSPHDSCIHIPMVISGPGFTGGRQINELIGLIDLPPTLLDVAGLKASPCMRGRSLRQVVQGCADWPDDVYIQISEDHVGRAVRTARYTYEVGDTKQDQDKGPAAAYPRNGKYLERCLYDNEKDPHQQNNLINDPRYAEVRTELRARIQAHITAAHEAVFPIEAAGVGQPA